jgi:hypothetical protein
LVQVGLDSRPVMREAYALFKDGGDPEKVRFADELIAPMCIRNSCPDELLAFTEFICVHFCIFSLFQTFHVALMVTSSIPHCTLDFIMILR